jgi:hypothetical protein
MKSLSWARLRKKSFKFIFLNFFESKLSNIPRSQSYKQENIIPPHVSSKKVFSYLLSFKHEEWNSVVIGNFRYRFRQKFRFRYAFRFRYHSIFRFRPKFVILAIIPYYYKIKKIYFLKVNIYYLKVM